MWYVECEGFGVVSYFSLSCNCTDSSDIRFGERPIYFDELFDCIAFADLLAIIYPDDTFAICNCLNSKRLYSEISD